MCPAAVVVASPRWRSTPGVAVDKAAGRLASPFAASWRVLWQRDQADLVRVQRSRQGRGSSASEGDGG